MNKIEINRPIFEDIQLINEFFQIVIKDTFERNGISNLVDSMENEIEDKKRCLKEDFESNGGGRYFLIAKDGIKIVGTIEYGKSNELINCCTNSELEQLLEIGTVFVHPDYQRMGIGSRMLKSIIERLKEIGVKEYCLDSGYKTAQQIWINKFGLPKYDLKNYWAENADHMIWRVSIEDILKS